jgi:hypothetical protein
MPKERISEKLIPKIYRRKFEDISMLFYVMGQRDIMPAISIEKAMYNYFRRIRDEDFNIESALATFGKLQKEYYESAKKDIGAT